MPSPGAAGQMRRPAARRGTASEDRTVPDVALSGTVDADLTTVRRSQILCASIKSVGRRGVDGARLKDIANEAGVSLGLVQHYFDTRQELMEQTFRVMLRLSLTRLRVVMDEQPDPLVTLAALVRMHVNGTVEFSERWGFWLELWSSARRDTTLAEITHDIYQLWTEPFHDAIEELQRQGRCRTDLSAADAVVILMGLIDGLAVRSLVDPQVMSLEQMEKRLLVASFSVLEVAGADRKRAVAELDRLPALVVTPTPLSPELVATVL
jgi:TetR/AcrR family transcriptional regulator, transcriptional repressor of bet genes